MMLLREFEFLGTRTFSEKLFNSVDCQSLFSAREIGEKLNKSVIRTLWKCVSNAGIGVPHDDPCCLRLDILLHL